MKTKNEIDYQELTKWALDLQLFGIKLGLSSTEALLSKLGDPQKQLKAVHIAGSNGKGSTAAFLAHILRESGFRVGFYSSPHLIDFRERFLIDWKMPSREKLAKYMVRVREVSDPTEPPTFFEFTTALAFLYFAEEGVDAALIETGLGGRLDATNIIRPQVSVITTLTLEHTQYLGRTIEEIALEKAGIIKEKTPVILGRVPAPAEDVIRRTAAEKGAPLYIYGRDFQARAQGSELDYKGLSLNLKGLKMGLAGPHQSRNAAVALAALEVFSSGPPMAEEAIRKGMAGLSWPGRLQVIGRDPLTILDGAHNPQACRALALALSEIMAEEGKTGLILVMGAMSDKDHQPMIQALGSPAREIVFTRPVYDRSAEPEDLARVAAGMGFAHLVERDLVKALDLARGRAGESDLVVVAGSLFVVGELLERLEISPFEEETA